MAAAGVAPDARASRAASPKRRARHDQETRPAATDGAAGYTVKAVITIIVTGLVGAVWLGTKVMLGK
jgi:hypothetical protein